MDYNYISVHLTYISKHFLYQQVDYLLDIKRMEKNTDTFQHDYSKKHLNMISSQGNRLLEESSLAQPGKTKKVSR